MGYLTTITVGNDRLHHFQEHPALFAETIFAAIDDANRTYREQDRFGGYLSVQPSRHADDHTVYVHKGNCVFNINPYGKDFQELLARSPEIAESFVKCAESLVKDAKAAIKEHKQKTKDSAAKI